MRKICLFFDYLSAIPISTKYELLDLCKARTVDEKQHWSTEAKDFPNNRVNTYAQLVTEMRAIFALGTPIAFSSLLKMAKGFQLSQLLSEESIHTLYELRETQQDRIQEIPLWALKVDNWFLVESKQPAFELQSALSAKFPCVVFDDGPLLCLAPKDIQVDLSRLELIIEMMGITQLWDLGNFGQGAKVIVLDTGFTPIYGVNASVSQKSITGLSQKDTDGHGTAICSIVGAIAPAADIQSIRIMKSYSEGSIWNLISGLTSIANYFPGVVTIAVGVDPTWLSSQGASIVAFEESISNIVQSANSTGHFLISAAGNDGIPALRWPAACRNVLAVGASNFSQRRSSFSNYSMETPNFVLAPGGERHRHDGRIEPLGRYGIGLSREIFGTSFSAAAASGFTALFQNYGWFNSMQIPSRISLFYNHCRRNEDGLPLLNVADIGAVWPLGNHQLRFIR